MFGDEGGEEEDIIDKEEEDDEEKLIAECRAQRDVLHEGIRHLLSLESMEEVVTAIKIGALSLRCQYENRKNKQARARCLTPFGTRYIFT